MPSFLSGYKFIIVPHPDGAYDRDMVAELYTSIVDDVENHQEEKIERDYRRIYALDEGLYFCVLRERVGVQSEHDRVRLGEFGIPGRLYPAYTSEFTIWDKQIAREWQQVIKELTTEGGYGEDITEIPV